MAKLYYVAEMSLMLFSKRVLMTFKMSFKEKKAWNLRLFVVQNIKGHSSQDFVINAMVKKVIELS